MNTFGSAIADGFSITAHCDAQGCWNSEALDLAALAGRFGADHGCTHWDLLRIFYCGRCRAAGRPDKDVRFIFSPNSTPYRWREVLADARRR